MIVSVVVLLVMEEIGGFAINVEHKEGKKKRKVTGRMTDVRKKINLTSHVLGADCNCRMKCFEVVPDSTKNVILKNFNLMTSAVEQDSYLCGLISVLPVARRRNRKPEGEARVNEATFKYRVRGTVADNTMSEFDVCKKAFIAIHGIGKKRVERLANALKKTGFSPKNKQGKHNNRL